MHTLTLIVTAVTLLVVVASAEKRNIPAAYAIAKKFYTCISIVRVDAHGVCSRGVKAGVDADNIAMIPVRLRFGLPFPKPNLKAIAAERLRTKARRLELEAANEKRDAEDPPCSTYLCCCGGGELADPVNTCTIVSYRTMCEPRPTS